MSSSPAPRRPARPTLAGSLALLALVACQWGGAAAQSSTNVSLTTRRPEEFVAVVHLNWPYVDYTVLAVIFLLIVALVGVIAHHLHRITAFLPETCWLILIGVAVAGIAVLIKGSQVDEGSRVLGSLSYNVFMLYLLPPIVLDAAYGLNDRTFAANIGTILMHAVIGTLINFLIIGPALYGLAQAGAIGYLGDFKLDLVDCFLYASLIVAVDPVAVIAIFKDVGVNDMLYYLVFGESLLNDAVTVVLYDMMSIFVTQEKVSGNQIAMGVAFFCVSSVGGAMVGLLMGVLTALITKYTYKLPSAEPIIVLMLAYMSYLLGQLFEWSSIIALTTCGLVQAQFAFPNIAFSSERTVKQMASVLGSTFEAFVFLFLGGEIIESRHFWSAGFIGWTILLILVARAISVYGLTTLINIVGRKQYIDFKHQTIMWWGGLRGALAFILCSSLTTDVKPRSLFLTTTIIVILFTVFVQGLTMRPVVSLLKVEMKPQEAPVMLQDVEDMTRDHMMSGIEVIAGFHGQNYVRERAYRVADKTKEFISKHSCTYENTLMEGLEARAFREVEAIREGRFYEPQFFSCCTKLACCCRGAAGCCTNSPVGQMEGEGVHGNGIDNNRPGRNETVLEMFQVPQDEMKVVPVDDTEAVEHI